jgi:hypothetical protein
MGNMEMEESEEEYWRRRNQRRRNRRRRRNRWRRRNQKPQLPPGRAIGYRCGGMATEAMILFTPICWKRS